MHESEPAPLPSNAPDESRSALLSAALDCIVTIDVQGRVLEFNPAAERTFGFPREEAIGHDLANLILPEEHREGHRAGLVRYLRSGESRVIGRRLVLEALRKDGTRFPVELTVTAYRARDGRPEFTAYMRDLSELEEERARRAEAASQLRQVTEHVDGVLALLEWPSARLLHMSGAFGSRFDLPEDVFSREPGGWKAFVAAEHRHLLEPLIARDPDLSELDFEVRREGKDSWLRVRVYPVRDADGRPERLVVHTESITALKRVARELERAQFILDRAGDAVFLMGRDARFVYVNEAACRMLGWKREELVGMTVFQIDAAMNPEEWPEHWAELERAQELIIESVHRRRDGTEFPVEVRVNYTELDGGTYNCAVVRDISERKAAEVAVRDAQVRSLAASRLERDLLANLGHEIRTPLAAMSGYLDLVRERPGSEADVTRWADLARNSCDALGSMLDKILELKRLEDRSPKVDAREVDLPRLLAGAVRKVRDRTGRRDSALSFRASSKLPVRVRVDAGLLETTLIELLTNAVRYSTSGEIELVAAASPSSLGARLSLVVEDQGVGIAPENVARVFERFVRAGPSVSGVDEGLGLGLAIARRHVEALQGRLELESEVGRGTRAVIELDVELSGDAAWRRSDPVRYAPSHGTPISASTLVGRVLVVEDTPELAALFVEWLVGWGLETVAVHDGAAALEQLDAVEFDLVLLDWRLPVLDGLEVVRRLRRDGSFVPVIAVTAHANAGAERECLEAGCSAFLAKPVAAAELHTRVAQLLAQDLGPGPAGAKEQEPWYRELRAKYVASLRAEVDDLAQALERGDHAEVKRRAHRIKGSAATFGFDAFAAWAEEVERLDLSRPGDLARAALAVEALGSSADDPQQAGR